MVEPRLLQQRQPDPGRIVAGKRLGVVVEVDEQRLVEAGLDEAVRVAVEAGVERLAVEEAPQVLDQHLAFEVGDRPGLRRRHTGRVADREHVRRDLGLQGVLVDLDEAELVAEARRAAHVRGAAVQRYDDGEVEGHLALVVGDELAALAVDLLRC